MYNKSSKQNLKKANSIIKVNSELSKEIEIFQIIVLKL